MSEDIPTGIDHTFTYTVPESNTIPAVFPDSDHFQQMPEALATAFYVGLIERAAIELLDPYLDFPKEQTVGSHISVSHEAPTPAGTEVSVTVEITEVEGRKISLSIYAEDEIDKIGEGTHTRFIVDQDRFVDGIETKAEETGQE